MRAKKLRLFRFGADVVAPIKFINSPEQPNCYNLTLAHLASEPNQNDEIVVLPFLTPREFLQLILMLQEASGEEYDTEDREVLVRGLHDKLRGNWMY